VREREIEALNDHLARLLAQGDEMLREWKGYSDGLRASIDRQIGEIDAQLAKAVEKAARTIAPRATQELSREIEALRAELVALRRTAGELGGGRRSRSLDWRRHLPLAALLLALLANGLLIVNLLRPPAPVPLLIDSGP
jgi:hypothetical protein